MLTCRDGQPVTRLGLGGLPDQDPACVRAAYDAGVNYFFFYGQSQQPFIEEIPRLAAESRDQICIATGSGSRTVAGLRVDRDTLAQLAGVDRFDVFFAEYLHPGDDPETVFGPDGLLDELRHWKDEGTIRYVGATAHDRSLARRLAEDPRVDVLMHRYNMAHRKAEAEVFPAAVASGTPIVAFTATRWATLLSPPADWQGPAATASDCYRYCLSHEAVALVLMAPKQVEELSENLAVFSAGPLEPAPLRQWEAYGRAIYEQGGAGAGEFETRWP